MSRYTIFADVAGRLSLDSSGGNRMTAAAVALSSDVLASVRDKAVLLPKWRDCSKTDAAKAIHLLQGAVASVSVVSMTKDPVQWPQFWEDAKPLHNAIVAQDNKPAGFIKPANVALFALLMHAYGMATGHAVKVSRGAQILNPQGLELVERTIVCDSDIQGEENIAAFKSFWEASDTRHQAASSLGFRFVTRDVIVATEQQEPLLLLADYAAGISHSAFIKSPGRLRLPVEHEDAKVFLDILKDSGKLVVLEQVFDVPYSEVFGEALASVPRMK